MKRLDCGCSFGAGQRIWYSDIRAHLTHVTSAIEQAATYCLIFELIQDRSEDYSKAQEWKEELQNVRMKLLDALADWQEKALPQIEKKFPENKIVEALGL